MQKINILFVIDTLKVGGAENQFKILVENLNRDRFVVNVCNLGSPSDALLKDISRFSNVCLTIPQKGKMDLNCLITLTRLIKKMKPHIVNTILFTAHCYGRISALWSKVPVIIASYRNIDLWKRWYHKKVDYILSKKTSHFTANSYALKRYLISEYNIPSSRITVIYNGIDLNKFKKKEKDFGIFKKLNIDSNKKVILTVGRFSPQKDYYTLIETAKKVISHYKNVLFLLIGRGPLKKEIERKINDEGLNNFFRIIEFVEDIEEVYNIACLSISTSLYEGLSNFILESMACEVPVIATPAGGNSELIMDNHTGFLVPFKDVEKIAERVIYLLSNPQKAEEIGRRARARVERMFAIEKMIKRYEDLYIEMVGF